MFGIRQYLARLIPVSIKIATGAGIGLYLCFIGLQTSAGIGLITADASTLVTLGIFCSYLYRPSLYQVLIPLSILGGCDSQYKDEVCTINKEDIDYIMSLTYHYRIERCVYRTSYGIW